MNPGCQTNLIIDGNNIGIMAHIVEHHDGGDVSFENLLLLCANCHKMVDEDRETYPIELLLIWKDNRNKEIAELFEKWYSSFEKLQEVVVPILERNGQIFDSYGPEHEVAHAPEHHELWLQFEHEVIANNRRLELLLRKNVNLLHKENQEIVNQFIAHAKEFVVTRGDKPMHRMHLFPRELLSIFGVAVVNVGFPSNLSALQNFVARLIKEDRLTSLELNETPYIAYLDKGETITIFLKDRPRLQQIFYAGRFFKPTTTNVRIDNLIFFVQWMYKNNIHYKFVDPSDLTTLILKCKYTVKLSYAYLLSYFRFARYIP